MTSGPPRILIVDDSAEDREAYRRLILRATSDYVIEEADCGEEGLRRCRADPPDCVLLDYALPDIDGLEFLDSLRAEPAGAAIPVVLLTGQGNETVAAEAIKRGAQDYIVKSAATMDSMRLALRGAIDRSVLRRMIERQSAVLDQQTAELREREGIFQLFVERAPAAMAMFDREMNHIAASDRWLEVYGPQGEDIRGRNHYEVYPEIPVRWREVHRRCLAGAVEQADEEEFIRADGTSQWVRWEVRPWRKADGDIGGLLIFSEDITQRKRSDEALRESREYFIRAQEVGQIGWWRLDTVNNILTWSDENYRIFGVPKGTQLSYESFLNTVHPDDRDFVHARWMAGLKGEPYDIEHRIVVGRAVKWVREKAYLEFNEDGALRGGFGITQDISERKQAEDALREAGRRKDEFLATLAHELRNPLAPIRNMAAVLRRIPDSDPKVGAACEVIERQIGQITRLVDDLLDISRIARGGLTIAREPCDLTDVVRCAVEDQRAQMEKQRLRLEAHLPNGPLPMRCDRHRIAQAVQNLLHNAQEFTPEGGAVSVTLSVDAGRAEIAVKDSGVGVPQELLADIFEPFHQGPQPLDRPAGGLGLGLAVVEGVARLHGGEATAANNADGPGAIFTMRLPLEPATAVPTETPNAADAHSRRVLLVEDDPLVADSTRMLLEVLGHHAKVASTGGEALKLARVFRPEIVLCDIGLPAPMDGFAVARAFRQDPALASTYLVALSGYGHKEVVEESRAAGFDLHLTKPVRAERLEQLLSEAPAEVAQV